MFVSLTPVPAAERCVCRDSIAFKILIADLIQRLLLKSCASSSSRQVSNLSLDEASFKRREQLSSLNNCWLRSRNKLQFLNHILQSCHSQSKFSAAAEAKGLNPGLIVLLVVGGPLLVFLIANYVRHVYAQKNLPPKKKKPVSKKKLKREKLKQGVPVPGE